MKYCCEKFEYALWDGIFPTKEGYKMIESAYFENDGLNDENDLRHTYFIIKFCPFCGKRLERSITNARRNNKKTTV